MPSEPPAGAGPGGAPRSEVSEASEASKAATKAAAAADTAEAAAGAKQGSSEPATKPSTTGAATSAASPAPGATTATTAAAPLPVAKVKTSKPGAAEKSAGLGATVRKRWRGWLRAIHRDVGYLAVGLTFIYALSGLAINHIQDWDPNFTSFSRETKIAPIPSDVPDDEAFTRVREALDLGLPRDTYRAGDEIHLTYDGREVVVYGDSGQVIDQGQSPRFFLRVANWLHYNRGKQAWTYIADAYAVLLLYLAISGLFMIKGKLGLRWRGTALVALGAAVPIAYVVLSGGPGGHKKTADATVAPSAPSADAADPPDALDEGERMRPRTPASDADRRKPPSNE